MKLLESNQSMGEMMPNIASLLECNAKRFAKKIVYSEKNNNGEYEGITWEQLYKNILTIATHLKKAGFKEGEKAVLFSRNSLNMLQTELAIMASGGIAVPIFANFKKETAELLITHSDASYLFVAGETQVEQISPTLKLKNSWTFDNKTYPSFKNLHPFSDLLKPTSEFISLKTEAQPNEVCLNMYTSGTMGIPKCVQLMHKNILSQQAALEKMWDINETDRFLSYLPWHHSFGGIFELFFCLIQRSHISFRKQLRQRPQYDFRKLEKSKANGFFQCTESVSGFVRINPRKQRSRRYFF